MPDKLYTTLGVAKNASQSDIKKAYRKLMKELHPDLNPGDKAKEARFKKVSAANDILGDPDKRALYDRGEIDENGAEIAQNPFGGGFRQGQHSGQGFGDMGDIFSQMFGGGQRGYAQAFKGQDQRYKLRVTFMEAALGGKKQVHLSDGSALNVNIPRGIEDGKSIRLKGKGSPGQGGGPAGDALIEIKIMPHAVFSRSGLDIEVTLPLTVYEAALGGKVEVPTLKGAVGLNIPAGSSGGKVLRLRGRGIESGAKKGDQLVTLQIQMPDTLPPEVETAMQAWKNQHAYSPRSKMKATV